MAEHAHIARFFAPLSQGDAGSFALTDDAAILTPPQGYQLVATTDSVIAGTHVMADATPAQIAQKLMRRNLSDLAAMGAVPWRYLLNLHTPALPDDWFADFTDALASEQRQFNLVLAGGDSTRGDSAVHATITCLGLVQGPPLLRSNAKAGDTIYVSGTVGDAALGLQLLQQTLTTTSAGTASLTRRYHTPEPRLSLGGMLRGVGHAVIDVSDGLLADAGHIAKASGVQLRLQRDAIPLSESAQEILTTQDVWHTILTGGDDYELLFTAPASEQEEIAALSEDLRLRITAIGVVAEGNGVMLDGVPATGGWEHR